MSQYDVYSYGVISASTLYLLQDHFPTQSGYAEFVAKYQHIGGEAANTSIVLARLGLKVKLDGNWINPDDDADFLRAAFNNEHIDISRLSFRSCRGPKEMLLVDAHTRTIFGTYEQLAKEQSWNTPHRTDIQQAQLICLDPFFAAASLHAAHMAKELDKPYITVDCQFDDPIFIDAAAAIISAEYLRDTYPDQSIPTITRAYKERGRGTLIFTFGHKEIIYASRDQDFKSVTPYRINPVDTTGAGDSFRAGIIYGLLQKWPTAKSIDFASALAALVCQSFPGVLNSPTYDEVLSFIGNTE